MAQPSAALVSNRYEFAADEARRLKPDLNSPIAFDIGTGEAPMRPSLERIGYTWRGFDLFPSSADVQRWDLSEPYAGQEKADLVLLMDVLEHLFNPGLAMSQISQAMKPNGRLILTVPNPKWSRSRIDLYRDGHLTCFTQNDLDVNHHVFTPWPHIVLKLLKDVGLEVEKYVTLDGWTTIPKPHASLNYPLRVARALVSRRIEERDPSSRGMSFGLVAHKL